MSDAAETYRGVPVPQPKCETVEKMCAKCPFRPDGSGYAQDHPDLAAITDLQDNAHTKRARRWLRNEGRVSVYRGPKIGADGWLRIHCGPWGGEGTEETVGHVDIERRRPW